MITYKKGNLLDSTDVVIAHGCNARGVMGSGVALAIREKYPWAFEAYRNDPFRSLGTVIPSGITTLEGSKIVLNCITQQNYGRDPNTRYVSYDAVDECMKLINAMLPAMIYNNAISMPKIGAGLGGGNWEIIEAIINYRLKDVDVTVWEL